MTSCPKCGGTEVDYNSARGETVCINCGTVLEESAMVEGLQFAEGSNGGLHLVGQFVPASGGRSFGTNFGSRESREQSISRGYGNIQKIADCLRLPSSHVEAAQRIYLMALQRNFTIGRNNYHVAFSCLYTVCRREKTPHMLIDFSDVLQSPGEPSGRCSPSCYVFYTFKCHVLIRRCLWNDTPVNCRWETKHTRSPQRAFDLFKQ